MNYERAAKRIEIATRSLLVFDKSEIESNGFADRKRISELYSQLNASESVSPDNNLKAARIEIIMDIIKEEDLCEDDLDIKDEFISPEIEIPDEVSQFDNKEESKNGTI
jgi:hypothetical protein